MLQVAEQLTTRYSRSWAFNLLLKHSMIMKWINYVDGAEKRNQLRNFLTLRHQKMGGTITAKFVGDYSILNLINVIKLSVLKRHKSGISTTNKKLANIVKSITKRINQKPSGKVVLTNLLSTDSLLSNTTHFLKSKIVFVLYAKRGAGEISPLTTITKMEKSVDSFVINAMRFLGMLKIQSLSSNALSYT